MIILPIKRKWFNMIKSGVKTEEYRELKPYYKSRFREFDFYRLVAVKFRNGYSRNSPSITCICSLAKGYGKQEWGAPDKECYILTINEIIKIEE